jgi:hypothetical protein
MSRPLSLIDERAYAATWVYAEVTYTERTGKNGEVIVLNPPVVRNERVLIVMRDDGVMFSEQTDKHLRLLSELGVQVHLPEIPRDNRLWSASGLMKYAKGQRQEPKDIFERMVGVVDRFLDFSLSLDEQKPMCEMVACQSLATWFLDAFNVIGYLWPNGAKGSGKTKLLYVVSEMGYLGEVILAGSSVPCLRDWADYGATLCYDEAENLDAKNADPDKLSLLLSGNRRGSTMTVKELVGDKWVMRHLNTYCPRLFSAIRLPGETLESRSIVIPLVRSADKDKANSDALNPLHWPCDHKSLIDDLWSLALTCLAKMPAYEDHVNRESELMGRALEPWRPTRSQRLL